MASDAETLAIVSIYDPDGVVDDYLVFYLQSLKSVADRMVVALMRESSLQAAWGLRGRENVLFLSI